VLSTFHRAKGLQWPVVFVAGLADGTVPIVSARTRAAREEERRLLYVALTRAESELCCTWALRDDRVAGNKPDRRPSPWLQHIEEAVAALRTELAPAGPDEVTAHLAHLRDLLEASAGTSVRRREGRSARAVRGQM
jgi:DNA helicase II / ATP-dependent DNA helicase PcrA